MSEHWYACEALGKRNKKLCSKVPKVAGVGRKMHVKAVRGGGGVHCSIHRSGQFLGGVCKWGKW